MKLELAPARYRALPLRIVEVAGGVLLKRGAVELCVAGSGAAAAVRTLLEAASGPGVAEEDIGALFPAPERAAARGLFLRLLVSRMLVPLAGELEGPARRAESPADVFYWQLDETLALVAERIAAQRLLILGVNRVSRQLARSLRESGAPAFAVRDVVTLRDPGFFDDDGALLPDAWPAALGAPAPHEGGAHSLDPRSFGCLVATAASGGAELLRPWNEHCVLHRRPFLPVLLEDQVGHVGPLVIPGETACFECFRLRRAAHDPSPVLRRAVDAAPGGWSGASALPPMASILGDVAAVELIKLLGLRSPLSRPGVVIEVGLLDLEMTARRVLRLPRCPVCTPIAERPTLASAKLAVTARGGGAL